MAIYSAHASGLGNSAAYQVAGKPYITGSLIDFESSKGFSNSKEYAVRFPTVTRKVTIVNNCTASDLAVYFVSKAVAPAVMTGVHYVIIPGSAESNITGSLTMDIKCTELYISPGPPGAVAATKTGNVGGPAADGNSFAVYAELTGVAPGEMYELTGSGISVSTWTDGQH